MPDIGGLHHWLARIAFVVAVVCIILALFGAAASSAVWIAPISWLTAAGVALLFGVYFILDGAVYAARKK